VLANGEVLLFESCLGVGSEKKKECAGLHQMLSGLETEQEPVSAICLDGTYAGGKECGLGDDAALPGTETAEDGFYNHDVVSE